MKTGILTFPNSVSFGAVLQMYALYKTVSQAGYDCEVINYHNFSMKSEKHVGKNKKKTLVSSIKKRLRKLLHYRTYSRFRRFEKKYISLFPRKSFSNKEYLKELSLRYNAVICGSDQVWNPEITDYDLSYYLDFCGKNTKRVSYAPSIGVEELSDPFAQSAGMELKRFHSISVREESGQKLVKKLSGRESVLVADPTFLIEKEAWRCLEKKHPLAQGDYILYYTVSRSDKLLAECLRFAESINMKVVIIGDNIFKSIRNKNPLIRYAFDIGPAEWLYLIDNAKYVFTNSFHGTAFSLNFQKNFFVEYPKSYSSRLIQLITDTGLESRVLQEEKKAVVDPVSYESVEKTLCDYKDKSIRFLMDSLKN